MAHRRTSNPSQFFQMSNPSLHLEIDQDWSYGHSVGGTSHEYLGRMGAPANASFSDPYTSRSGFNSASPQNLESRSIDHSSGNIRFEGQRVHMRLPDPSRDVLPPFPRVDCFYPVPETNAAYTHSSHYNRHIIHEVEAGLVDHMIGTGRGPFKRKSPDLSVPWERGSSSAVYGQGSSSSSFELQVEKPTSDYRNHPSASTRLSPYVGGSLLIGEDSPRNVRSRSRLDLEPNPRRSYLSSHFSCPSYSASHLRNHHVAGDITNLNADANANAYDRNLIGVSPPTYGMIHTSANNSSSQEFNHYYVEGNPVGTGGHNYESILNRNPVDTGGHNHDSILNRNPMVPHQYHYGFNPHAALEGQGSYPRRALHSRRTELRSSALGQEAVGLDGGRQHLSEPFSSRYLRPLPPGNWHNNHREGRPRVAIESFHSVSNAVGARDRVGPEAHMMLDHSYLYGSRNLFDSMRLDVDSMSYEELLDLGERIGHVNTGFSEDVILKCLTVTICLPADKTQEETSCAICLEEYKTMEEVGTVKNCGHGYHVKCITKWLSMKNACPICKAPAVNDGSNHD